MARPAFFTPARRTHRLGQGVALATLVSVTACGGSSPWVTDARGSAERHVTGLWWSMLVASIVVTAFVVAMGVYGLVTGRRRDEAAIQRHVPWGERFVLIAGLGVAGVILAAFFLVSVSSMAALEKGARSPALTIDITGHDWWWEARYPNGAVTANEIHIPAGRRVGLRLRSADVIHSLWVPQLAPKIDLIPGRLNHLWLEADTPGRYRGQCAEYCGLQHAHMIFFIVADPPAAFDRWMAGTAEPAVAPTDPLALSGRALFLGQTCAGCHSIRGTSAAGTLGPDLTHFATRSTLAAGTLPVDAADLAQWILDPQSLKPGVTMPPTALTQDQVRAIVAYLLNLGFASH